MIVLERVLPCRVLKDDIGKGASSVEYRERDIQIEERKLENYKWRHDDVSLTDVSLADVSLNESSWTMRPWQMCPDSEARTGGG